MDEETYMQCLKLAIRHYAWHLKLRGIKEGEEAFHELEKLAWAVRNGEETDETLVFSRIYERTMPGAITFNQAEKEEIWCELRLIAHLFQVGLTGFSDPEHQLVEEKLQEETIEPTLEVIICSDVHLGTKQSNRQAFYEWLDSQSNVQVVLLGDILDLWINAEGLDDDQLIQVVSAEWRDLHSHLARAKTRGCNIHIVPGNHDAFIYYIEAAESDPWVASVLQLTPILARIKQEVKNNGAELLSVAQLHYPYFRLFIANRTFLLTHGHYSNWGWRLLAGLDDAGLDIDSSLVTASVSLAHKHARLLRQFVSNYEWLRRTHLIEDTAISITNAVLSAYGGARELLKGKDGKLIEIIDAATALYFNGQANVSPVEELKLRTALLHMVKHHQEHHLELQSIRLEHERFLKKALCTSNIDITAGTDGVNAVRTALREYSDFDTLIFGHFHDPRDTEGIHDSGSFVDFQRTFIKIDSNGLVFR